MENDIVRKENDINVMNVLQHESIVNIQTENKNDKYVVKDIVEQTHIEKSEILLRHQNNINDNDIIDEADKEEIGLKNCHSKRSRLIVSEDESDIEETSDKRNGKAAVDPYSDNASVKSDDESTNMIFDKSKCKRLLIRDSDSEEVEESEEGNLVETKITTAPVFKLNDRKELIDEGSEMMNANLNKVSDLYDSESSDDEIRPTVDQEKSATNSEDETIQPIIYKKKIKKKSELEDQPKKMTSKDAAELRKEIKSESQRMVRESNVTLPYHRPKSHSLKEFLARRPKLAINLPSLSKTSPSLAIKMSTEQLKIVSDKLKEREKELKEFYKSESEESDDEDDDKDYKPPNDISDKTELENTCNAENDGNLEKMELNNSDADGTNKDGSEKNIDRPISTDENLLEDAITHDLEANTKEPIVQHETTKEPLNSQMEHDSPNTTDESTCINNTDNELLQEVNKQTEQNSFDFNLDGIEENTETEHLSKKKVDTVGETEGNNEDLPAQKKCVDKYTYDFAELDREIENFNPDAKEESVVHEPKLLTRAQLLKEQLANIKPRLSGGPNEIIDLDANVTRPNEVTKLMERFMNHAKLKKSSAKNKVKLSIVTVESDGDINKETVAMNVDDDEEIHAIEEKPGEKLKKLRGQLQHQMIEAKSKIWQEKASKGIRATNQEADVEYEDDCDDLLDDEEEGEMTESEEDEEEDLLNDDMDIKDKPMKKSVFVDDEAEDSDLEDLEDGTLNKVNDKSIHYEENCKNVSDLEDDESEDDVECNLNDECESEKEEPIEMDSQIKKPLKRIIKAFEESDEESDNVDNHITKSPSQDDDARQLDSTVTADEDDMFIPPHQQPTNKTPVRQVTPTRSHFDILSSISLLSGVLCFNETSKESPKSTENEDSSNFSLTQISNVPKKLFDTSTISEQELICSGIPDTQEEQEDQDMTTSQEPTTDASLNFEDVPPSTQDLLNICSGQFSGISEASNQPEHATTARNEDCYSKTVDLTQRPIESSQVKSLDATEDLVISQLLDEDELERFKKKFESPVITASQKEECQEIVGGIRIESDEDDFDENTQKRKKFRKRKKIVFSDDDSSDEDIGDNDDAGSNISDVADKEETESIAADNIGYDSEENEIEVKSNDIKKPLRTADFFEDEAELSESEWGSADEDEKDLDKLEFEEGDTEKFDDDEMREDIEKVNLRRMLDDDNREIKLLQEIFLEDGELHGTGRQRQFKWRNIDSTGAEIENGENNDDDTYLEDGESEEQWRKRRYEREMFLKEKLKSTEDSSERTLLNASQLLKIGHKVLQKSQPNSQYNTPNEKSESEAAQSPVTFKNPLDLFNNQRGSFLARGDQVLQRLAVYSKVTTTELGMATAKNSKNFLFHTVSTSKTSVSIGAKKRKAAEDTPPAIKKYRRTNINLNSPGVNKKTTQKPERAKNLFNISKYLD